MPETRSSAKKAASAGEKHETDQTTATSPPETKRVKESSPQSGDKEGKGSHKRKSGNGTEDKNGNTGDGTKPSSGRMPSTILEKGIIYFFVRGRVNTDSPTSVDDLARTYFIMRPIPLDKKLAEGPLEDARNARLFVLPRKRLPGRGDRVMAFVDKAHATLAELRKEFLEGSEYETKTAGTRHIPEATPVGEGAYAITHTGKESHLCYLLSVPSDLGEVQQELGLDERGSFILSTKNPEFPGPGYARLPQKPDYPEEIMEDFASYRWISSKPEHLDYQNTQVLLVGERGGLGRSTEMENDSPKKGELDPQEAVEEVEEADIERMEHLGEDDSEAIYADLKAYSGKYPSLQTSFG